MQFSVLHEVVVIFELMCWTYGTLYKQATFRRYVKKYTELNDFMVN